MPYSHKAKHLFVRDLFTLTKGISNSLISNSLWKLHKYFVNPKTLAHGCNLLGSNFVLFTICYVHKYYYHSKSLTTFSSHYVHKSY